jgi:phosphoglycolate phosphatase
MTPQRFVVFDCDGTLVDSQFMISESMRRAFAAHDLAPLPREEVRRIVGLRLEEAIAKLVPELPGSKHQEIADSYRESFFELHDDQALQEPLYDGAKAAVQNLHDAGYLLGIATGKSRRGLDRILANYDLRKYFSDIRTADDGPGKPNPQILLDAMGRVGVDASSTAVIGDTTFDISLAVNAKAYGIGVEWGYHEVQELLGAGAVQVIGDFSELPSVLTKLWGK